MARPKRGKGRGRGSSGGRGTTTTTRGGRTGGRGATTRGGGAVGRGTEMRETRHTRASDAALEAEIRAAEGIPDLSDGSDMGVDAYEETIPEVAPRVPQRAPVTPGIFSFDAAGLQ